MDVREIETPDFIKNMTVTELESLSEDIRDFLIDSISKTGGHLSSNLGIVELTIALHYVFDSPKDKIFFDVGHQSYVHKILTGRAKNFSTLRKFNGLSGFQKFCESEHDVWEAGHSSTALSAAVGMAIARDLDQENYEVIPVIGDAAMVGGPSLEALNHLGSTNSKVIIILNDNQMSIGKSVGGFENFLGDVRLSKTYNHLKEEYRHLLSNGKIRSKIYHTTKKMKDFMKRGFIKEAMFSEFGIEYLGPVDGHDFKDLCKAFEVAKESNESVIIHVVTKKGKGYPYAQKDVCGKWHGISPFDINTGISKTKSKEGYLSWSQYISNHVEKYMAYDANVVAVTPAMIHGSAMENIFKRFPKRSFDVGIAEQHAMTFIAGLATKQKKPFLSVYSSFLQRAYDQVNHDIARMCLPCLVAIDRAGLVGADGPTHHGVFDISFLQAIPNIILFAPKDGKEAAQFINTAFYKNDRPYFIRIPRSDIPDVNIPVDTYIDIGTWEIASNETIYDATIVCYGDTVKKVITHFSTYNKKIRVINARFIKPMDTEVLKILSQDNKPLIVYETDMKIGGLASNMSYYYTTVGIHRKMTSIGLDDHYSKQGTINELLVEEQMDLKSVEKVVEDLIDGERKN